VDLVDLLLFFFFLFRIRLISNYLGYHVLVDRSVDDYRFCSPVPRANLLQGGNRVSDLEGLEGDLSKRFLSLSVRL
jgi:hypothetical protein